VWRLEPLPRGALIHRDGPFRFDIDGVAKGWMADRALELFRRWPAALVDADGDIAIRPPTDRAWFVEIADPRREDERPLAVLRLDGRLGMGSLGIATSGTSVHRWSDGPGERPRHHLLDPVTRRPAATDIVQASVIGASAREAEVLARSAIIAGSDAGVDLLERSPIHGALLLLTSGETIVLPRTLEWLA
jgi:thiamine biosynthesis lipoprotein